MSANTFEERIDALLDFGRAKPGHKYTKLLFDFIFGVANIKLKVLK